MTLPLTELAVELVDLNAEIEQVLHAQTEQALYAARNELVRQDNELERQVLAVRARHAAGELSDDVASRSLWLLEEERQELRQERDLIDELWRIWLRRPTPDDNAQIAVAVAGMRIEEQEAIEAWRKAWAETWRDRVPTCPPVSNEEIAEWRDWYQKNPVQQRRVKRA